MSAPGRRPSPTGKDRVDVPADDERRGAALDAVTVALVVDAPEFVRDQLATVRVERRVRVQVDDRGRAPVGGGEHPRVDGDLALLRFQYVHIGRSWTTSPAGSTSMVAGSSSSDQKRFAHGPGAMTSCSPTSIRPRPVSSALAVPSAPSSIARTSTPLRISDALGALAREPEHRLAPEREAALVLVQERGGFPARASRGTAPSCRQRPPPRR